MLKRCIDLVLIFIGFVLTLPFLPLIALLIKIDSSGPVFYRCDRVGKGGKIFKMYKFRTMYEYGAILPMWTSVSPKDDPRVTTFGSFLRRTKMNELPQLLNILKGEMTFVGPRPEAPDLAALYPAYAKAIFTVTPGLVGPNQILGRNEEEWYPEGVDPQQYYITEILPRKLPLDLEYVHRRSLYNDLCYIVLGLRETIFKTVSWKLVLQNKSQIYLLGADFILSMFSFGLAHLLRFEQIADTQVFIDSLPLLPIVVLIRIPCFFYFGLYRTLIRYISSTDIWNIFKSISTSSFLFVGLIFLFDLRAFSRAVWLIDGLCLFFCMVALRLALRLFYKWQSPSKKPAEAKRRVFIFGAGNAGVLAFHFLQASQMAYEVIGFLDDDPTKRHKTLCGYKVLGNRHNLKTLVQLYRPHEVLLAIPSASVRDITTIGKTCQSLGVPYQFFPMPSEERRVRPAVSLCETCDVPLTAVTSLPATLTGKRVVVAGTSGALGLELCQQILRFAPERLLVLERSEPSLTALVAQLQETFPTASITPVLCTPVGNTNLEAVFLEYHPHVVFQNAMRKYLPFFPFQTESILRANYLSTFALAQLAARSGCTHFVLVSSEEARRQNTVIAVSLRTVEVCLRTFFDATSTHLVVARLGDILEHRAGIVARLEERIANREPIILPHRDTKCALLSKRAAVHLILDALGLTESLAPRKGIFVCPQAAEVSVLDVAYQLAILHGYQLGIDIPLDFLRPSPIVSLMEEAHAPYIHAKLIPTSNPNMSLLQEVPLASSAATKAVQELLSLQESDLTNDCWKRPTRTLLEYTAQTSQVLYLALSES